MAVAVETRRVRVTRAAENANETNVTNETNASNTTLRVERHVARFHAGDVFRTVAALTKPLASVRAGRLLETRAVDAETSRETLRLVPESASRRAAKNARAFDERLELWLRVDGALEIVHVRDPQTSAETLARVGADAADARRRIAAATRELAKRRNEAFDESIDASFGDVRRDLHETTTDAFRGARPILTRPLPNDASGRAFRFVAGTGAGSRASYFWLRDARVEDGANALASFAEKVNDPPTLSDVAGVPPDRLNALALAAPALAQMVHDGSFERASLPSGAGLGLGHGAFSGFLPGRSASRASRATWRASRRRARGGPRRGDKKRFEAPRRRAGTRGLRARGRSSSARGLTRRGSANPPRPCGLERARTNRRARHRRVETRLVTGGGHRVRGGAARVRARPNRPYEGRVGPDARRSRQGHRRQREGSVRGGGGGGERRGERRGDARTRERWVVHARWWWLFYTVTHRTRIHTSRTPRGSRTSRRRLSGRRRIGARSTCT